MSFSSEVKEELSRHIGSARHCKIAETAAIVSMCGRVQTSPEGACSLRFQTENASVSRKYFTLLRKTFNINTEISIARNPYLKKSNVYTIVISGHEETLRVLETTKLICMNHGVPELAGLVNPVVVQKDCCKRAFIRGAFWHRGLSVILKSSIILRLCVRPGRKQNSCRELFKVFM